MIERVGGIGTGALVSLLMAGLSIIGGCQFRQAEATSDLVASDQDRLIARLRRLPTVKSVAPWQLPEGITDRSSPGLNISTAHYDIYTSLTDPLILMQVPVFLESAFRSYSQVIDYAVMSREKLPVYFFDTRDQWEDYTRDWTGPAAPVYLKIRSGAYYFKGRCVAYHLGRRSNFAVLAHEGWHQFSDRFFYYRLPAWLDEGLATNFEAYRNANGRVTFAPPTNGSRLLALQEALAQDRMMALSEIITLDAGRILSHAPVGANGGTIDPTISAYYAQLYALIRFLREEGFGQRRAAFRELLNDAYRGRWALDAAARAQAINKKRNPSRRWNAEVGQRLFQSYIAADIDAIEPAYQMFCRKIVSRLQISPH